MAALSKENLFLYAALVLAAGSAGVFGTLGVKNARAPRGPAARVQLADSPYTLTVADNGVGLPAGLNWTNTNTLGLVLVRMLGQHQLQGYVELDRSGGTTFRLRFVPRDRDMTSDG